MNNLAKLRKEKNLSQQDLAALLGVAQNTISQWECGVRDLDSGKLEMLSKFFNVSTDYILGVSIHRNPPPSDEARGQALDRVLVEIGFIQPGEEISDVKAQALREFIQNNQEFLTARAKQLEEGGDK